MGSFVKDSLVSSLTLAMFRKRNSSAFAISAASQHTVFKTGKPGNESFVQQSTVFHVYSNLNKQQFRMPCNEFAPDVYNLYVLGLLDDAQRIRLDAHVQENCANCICEVQRSMNLWVVFASTLETAEPSADFRLRLLRIAELSKKVLTFPKHAVEYRPQFQAVVGRGADFGCRHRNVHRGVASWREGG